MPASCHRSSPRPHSWLSTSLEPASCPEQVPAWVWQQNHRWCEQNQRWTDSRPCVLRAYRQPDTVLAACASKQHGCEQLTSPHDSPTAASACCCAAGEARASQQRALGWWQQTQPLQHPASAHVQRVAVDSSSRSFSAKLTENLKPGSMQSESNELTCGAGRTKPLQWRGSGGTVVTCSGVFPSQGATCFASHPKLPGSDLQGCEQPATHNPEGHVRERHEDQLWTA